MFISQSTSGRYKTRRDSNYKAMVPSMMQANKVSWMAMTVSGGRISKRPETAFSLSVKRQAFAVEMFINYIQKSLKLFGLVV